MGGLLLSEKKNSLKSRSNGLLGTFGKKKKPLKILSRATLPDGSKHDQNVILAQKELFAAEKSLSFYLSQFEEFS